MKKFVNQDLDDLDVAPNSRGVSVQILFQQISERWTIHVLYYLADNGSSHFSTIAKGIDGAISNRMLALTLRKLETNGLVRREQNGSSAVYRLSDLGRSLLVPFDALFAWTIENAGSITEKRKEFGLEPLIEPLIEPRRKSDGG